MLVLFHINHIKATWVSSDILHHILVKCTEKTVMRIHLKYSYLTTNALYIINNVTYGTIMVHDCTIFNITCMSRCCPYVLVTKHFDLRVLC